MNKSCRNLKNQWEYLTSFQSYWNRRYLLFNNGCANCHVGDIPQRNVSGISQGEKSRKKRLMMDCESCQTYLLHSCSEVWFLRLLMVTWNISKLWWSCLHCKKCEIERNHLKLFRKIRMPSVNSYTYDISFQILWWSFFRVIAKCLARSIPWPLRTSWFTTISCSNRHLDWTW